VSEKSINSSESNNKQHLKNLFNLYNSLTQAQQLTEKIIVF